MCKQGSELAALMPSISQSAILKKRMKVRKDGDWKIGVGIKINSGIVGSGRIEGILSCIILVWREIKVST